MTLKKILASAVAAVLAVSSMAVFTSAEDSYNAGICYQTASWMYRDGLDSDEVSEGDIEADDYEVKDAVITKDGTYTVEVSGIPEDTGAWHSIKLVTTIPYSEEVVGKVKIIAIEADGQDTGFDPATSNVAPENSKGNLWINMINEWNDDIKDNPSIENKPYTSLKVTFTVEGLFGGDSASSDENSNPAGNTNQATDDKNSPDTGVEGVAVVAGLAVIAAGAVVVSKKRK